MSKKPTNLKRSYEGPYYAYRCKIVHCYTKQSFWITAFGRFPAEAMETIKPMFSEPFFTIQCFHIINRKDNHVIFGGLELPISMSQIPVAL